MVASACCYRLCDDSVNVRDQLIQLVRLLVTDPALQLLGVPFRRVAKMSRTTITRRWCLAIVVVAAPAAEFVSGHSGCNWLGCYSLRRRRTNTIITPTTKAESGHDERLTVKEVVDKGLLDDKTWEEVQAAALAIFKRGQQVAAKAGLILVDTKYEFGRTPDGKVVLIDEVHTPDSSRYWKADSYRVSFAIGQESENFDKELVRRAYIERGYQGEGTPPELAPQLWAAVSQRYMSIYEMLSDEKFDPGKYPVEPRLRENLKTAGIL